MLCLMKMFPKSDEFNTRTPLRKHIAPIKNAHYDTLARYFLYILFYKMHKMCLSLGTLRKNNKCK